MKCNSSQFDSKLVFENSDQKIQDDDIEGQLKLRSSRFWGRLYIDGWPQTIQYFVAHFGLSPPYGQKKIVFAEPKFACEPIQNLNKDYIVLVHRGNCTFSEKAKFALASNASAIIIINKGSGVEHLHGTSDVRDIQISVSSISETEGTQLVSAYNYLKPGEYLNGYMVPISCSKSFQNCKPATVEEAHLIKDMNEGGTILLNGNDNNKIEYLIARFGTMV